MESKKDVNDNKKLVLGAILVVVLLVVAIILSVINVKENNKTNTLTPSVNNTTIEEVGSYKMDLRIFGTYNKKGIYNTIMVTNYENSDKEITITGRGETEEKYLVKDGKNYSVKDEKLTEVDTVPYANTESYLTGVNNLKEVTQGKDEEISKVKYKVYTGKISVEDMNNILKSTELGYTTSNEGTAEVWLTEDNHVYKVYYKVDELTVYASYFGYGKMNKVNLDAYKK